MLESKLQNVTSFLPEMGAVSKGFSMGSAHISQSNELVVHHFDSITVKPKETIVHTAHGRLHHGQR